MGGGFRAPWFFWGVYLMATGTTVDLNIRNPFLHTALTERLTQFSDAFNAASLGAIRLTTASKIGFAEHETFFTSIAGLITRRDTTSVAAAPATKLVNVEKTAIKLDRKIGPVENTISSFNKIGMSTNEMQVAVGEQAAVAMAVGMLNDGLGSLVAAIKQNAAAIATVAGPITTASLVSGMFKLGDRQDRIVCWIMHSFQFAQLIQNQIAANINGISSFNIINGTPITMGRPVIISDSPSLVTANGAGAGNDYYWAIGLTEGALDLVNSEEENVLLQIVTGLENLVARIQGEYAYNMGMKGYTYDLTNGGNNPSAAALTTAGNWDLVVTDYKDGPGVLIRSQTT